MDVLRATISPLRYDTVVRCTGITRSANSRVKIDSQTAIRDWGCARTESESHTSIEISARFYCSVYLNRVS